jgi:magnesium-transporting ATPase (P-type)
MPFSLIDNGAGAVPLVAVSKAGLASWRAAAPERERDWVAATRFAGQAEIPLDEFLMPMVLASDAVISDGELIGDPTEGALVAVAAKGGVDAVTTRQAYPD